MSSASRSSGSILCWGCILSSPQDSVGQFHCAGVLDFLLVAPAGRLAVLQEEDLSSRVGRVVTLYLYLDELARNHLELGLGSRVTHRQTVEGVFHVGVCYLL